MTKITLESRLIPTSTGAVHCVLSNSEKPALIFLHGFSQDLHEFEPVMQLLADNFTVIAIDLPGIGLSENNKKTYDAQCHATTLHETLNALGVVNPYFVAHDMSGVIAYAYARLYPTQTRGVMVLDAPLPGTPSTDLMVKLPFLWHFTFHRIPHLPEKIIHNHEATYFKKAFFHRFTHNKQAISEDDAERYAVAYKSMSQLKAGLGLYRAYKQDRKFVRDHRDQLDVPLVIVESDFGSKEPGPTAKQLRDSFGCTNVEAFVAVGIGHFIPSEAPEFLAEIVRKNN